MRKTVTKSFFQYHAEKFDFLPTKSSFVVLEKVSVIIRSSTCTEESTFQSRHHSESTDRVLLKCAGGILGTNPQS